MLWLKHYNTTWDDEKIATIVDKFGLEGYGYWWRLLEIISQQNLAKNPPEITLPIRTSLSRFCLQNRRRFLAVLENLAETELIIKKTEGELLTISIPNRLRGMETKCLTGSTIICSGRKNLQIRCL